MFKLKVVYALLWASRNPKFRECVRKILVDIDYKVKSRNTDNVYNMRANTVAKAVGDIENQALVEDYIKDSKQKLPLRSAISYVILTKLYEDLGKPLQIPEYK